MEESKPVHYLDWASAAPVSTTAQKAFLDALTIYGNPSSPHSEGARAHDLLEASRQTIARLAGTKSNSVIFTSGATESNALAIQGHIKALRDSGRAATDIHLLYMPTAHASVVDTMKALAREDFQIEPLVIKDGTIDLSILAKQIRTTTAMVSMDLICGETGTRYDTRDVRRVLDSASKKFIESGQQMYSSRILLQVDASQAPFVESFEHTHLGADLITLDAQKVGGVRGIGVLIRVHPLTLIKPLIYGGGQEQGLRPGTESSALAAAFATALTEADQGRESFLTHSAYMRNSILSELEKTWRNSQIKLEINSGKEYAPHIINLSFSGIDTDYAVMLLSEAGYAVSTRSACETDSEEGSHVVLALTNDPLRAVSTLRISWGPTTNPETVEKFQKELISTIEFLHTKKVIN